MSAASGAAGHLRVRCRRHAVAPTVAVRVWLVGGALAESHPGAALLTGRMLTEGTAGRSWGEITAAAEDRGMDLAGSGGAEVIGISIDALAADWRPALELAAELALEPSFPEDRLARLRRQATGELESLMERPEVVTAWAFLRQLYGEGHPLSRPPQGSAESLAALSRSDCVSFHRRSLAGEILVVVAGEVEEQRVLTAIGDLFGPGASGPARLPDAVAARRRDDSYEEIELSGTEQAEIYVGQLTVPADHPDLPALQLAAVVLGSGPGLVGRIPGRVREREGLAYSASAGTVGGAGRLAGRLVVHLATAPERISTALAVVHEEIERFVADGLTDEEMEEARTYLLGSEAFRRESPRQVASLEGLSMLYGVGWNEPGWMEAALSVLDRKAVEEAVRRHIDIDRLAVVVGRPVAD